MSLNGREQTAYWQIVAGLRLDYPDTNWGPPGGPAKPATGRSRVFARVRFFCAVVAIALAVPVVLTGDPVAVPSGLLLAAVGMAVIVWPWATRRLRRGGGPGAG